MKSFDSRMYKAWLILATIGVVIFASTSKESPYAIGSMAIISIVSGIIYPAIVIFLLNKLATEHGMLPKKIIISVWGYVWRAIVIQYVALIIAGIFTAIVIGKGPYITIPSYVFFFTFYILSSLIICWAIFSRDRKSQFKWLLSFARGY